MATVYLGLGSNLGDRAKNIHDAVRLLDDAGIKAVQLSTIIETSPVGGPPQGLFLNAVLKAETDLLPFDVLSAGQMIEAWLGRVRLVKDGPRTIDIDILLYDEIVIDTPELTIPHPRMMERVFVMAPLREVKGA
ncbi:MAG: 2-amino-4-hydroxy-6-hydroxymethyldihydropteridine diphosphokinase [Candidatus Omnitrophota bacterium]